MDKLVTGECENCESTFEIAYNENLVSDDIPTFCPFCGENVDHIQEEYIEDDELNDDDKWD